MGLPGLCWIVYSDSRRGGHLLGKRKLGLSKQKDRPVRGNCALLSINYRLYFMPENDEVWGEQMWRLRIWVGVRSWRSLCGNLKSLHFILKSLESEGIWVWARHGRIHGWDTSVGPHRTGFIGEGPTSYKVYVMVPGGCDESLKKAWELRYLSHSFEVESTDWETRCGRESRRTGHQKEDRIWDRGRQQEEGKINTGLGGLNVCNMQMQLCWRHLEMQVRHPRDLDWREDCGRVQCLDHKCGLGNCEELPETTGQEEKQDWEPQGAPAFKAPLQTPHLKS